MTMVDTAFDPMDLVKEDLQQPVIETALQTIKRLPVVAKAIGPANTRDKLVVFLNQFAGFDTESKDNPDKVVSDEALAEIARVLVEFLPLVGGVAFANPILVLLENFAVAQETCVREAAVETLRGLAPKFAAADPKSVSTLFVPLAKRLSAEDWFSSRCSATGIIPVIYAHVHDEAEKASLRQMFLVCCKDETPLVRKYAYDHVGELAINTGPGAFRADLSEVLKNLMEETQENLRIVAVDVAQKMAESCRNSSEDFKELVYPLIEHIGSEQSWRVRKCFAKAIGDIATFMSKEHAGQLLMPYYHQLLKDPETEVRLSAVRSLSGIAKNVDQKSFGSGISEALEGIMTDSVQSTRIALSEIILEVAPFVGRDVAAKALLPVIVRLLESDVAEMKSNVLEKLNMLAEAIGLQEVIQQFLPKVLPMAKDPKWRVRKLVVENSISFSKHVGPDVFESSFKPILFDALNDTVFGVREVAAKQIALVVDIFGFDWASRKLLPEVLNFNLKATNYLHRMVPLLVSYELCSSASSIPAEYFASPLGALIVGFSKDPVVNVRSFSVKTLAVLAKRAPSAFVGSTIRPTLMTLTQDSDTEVKLSAARILMILQDSDETKLSAARIPKSIS